MKKNSSAVPRLWVCPVNDGEAVEIRNLLLNQGEQVVVTNQPWGATWAGLEADVVQKIEEVLTRSPDTQVIGIELGGASRWVGRNIDHHRYKGDDRSNPLSSLEQVAKELEVELNRHQRLVAANDVGYIPALIAAGALPDEIEIVRQQDRCAQGVNPDQEAQAVRDIAKAEHRGRKVLVVCPKGVTSAHSDRLYGSFDELMAEAPDKWVYYGPRAWELGARNFSEHHWHGGDPRNGYFGIIAPSDDTQKYLREFFWK